MSKITLTLLKKLFPGTSNSDLVRFVDPFNIILPKYDITTKKRFAAFIANVGIESDHLKALQEYASGTAYEGRKNLGNVRAGDGVRYKGRSVLQTTGRYNYWKVVVAYLRVLTGKNWDSKLAETDFSAYLNTQEYTDLLAEADKYNVNFLAHPQLLEEFPHAVEAAGVFVKDKNLNSYADSGNFFGYAGILNKGSDKKQALSYGDRKALYTLAMAKIPEDFELDTANVEPDVPVPQPFVDSNVSTDTNSGNVTQNVDVTTTSGDVVVPPPAPAPQPEPITIKSVTTSMWTKVLAAFAAISGMGINAGSMIQTKVENITANQVLIFAMGTGLVILAVFYFKKRQEAADSHTAQLIIAAADPTKNTVKIEQP